MTEGMLVQRRKYDVAGGNGRIGRRLEEYKVWWALDSDRRAGEGSQTKVGWKLARAARLL
jgi:hypothetical protein